MSGILLILFITSSWASPSGIPFEQALEEIIDRSTSVKAKQANLEATRAKNIPSRLYYIPSLSITGNQTSTRDLLLGQDTSVRSVQGTATLNLYKFGADLAAYRAATADEESQINLLKNEILKSEHDGITALVQQIRTQQQGEIIYKIVTAQEESLKIAKQRYDRGLLPQQEVDKLSIDLENLKASFVEAQINQYEAHANLTTLLGHAQVEHDWPWKDKFSKAFLQDLKRQSFDVTQRPDWKAAQAKVEGEDQRYNKNWGLIFPVLDASFTYGYYDYYTSVGRTGGAWSVGVTLTIPLFDRLTNYSAARTQLYVRNVAEQQLEQAQRFAKNEWESSRASFETALESALSREKALVLSRKLYLDNLLRFRGGRIHVNEFILDQTRLFNSEKFVVEGWAAVHLAYMRLCHALGRRVAQCNG